MRALLALPDPEDQLAVTRVGDIIAAAISKKRKPMLWTEERVAYWRRTGKLSELAADYRSVVSTPTKPGWSTATLTLAPAHFGHTHLIVVTVDPANEITEDDETNNQTRFAIALPVTTASARGPCVVQRG